MPCRRWLAGQRARLWRGIFFFFFFLKPKNTHFIFDSFSQWFFSGEALSKSSSDVPFCLFCFILFFIFWMGYDTAAVLYERSNYLSGHCCGGDGSDGQTTRRRSRGTTASTRHSSHCLSLASFYFIFLLSLSLCLNFFFFWALGYGVWIPIPILAHSRGNAAYGAQNWVGS